MQEYTVIKKGSSIHKCIKFPADLMDKDLEIRIRPLEKIGNISQKILRIFKENPNAKPFQEIKDPRHWQREIRTDAFLPLKSVL